MKKYPVSYNPILEYWAKIESGEIIVGNKIRRVYKQLAFDVFNQDSEYEYSPKRANHAIEFIENFCRHSKGKWGGKRIELELWQKAGLAAAFGFVHKIDGTRKYREVLIIVARKNGKSTLGSGISLYLQIADGEPGPEVYAVATKKDQAKIVWLDAKKMVKKSPFLLRKIKPLVGEMVSDWNDSVFKPLGADSETLDGLNVHGAMMDEIHAWKDKNLYDVVADGTSAREQPMIFMITTAGTVRESLYDDKYAEAERWILSLDDENEYTNDRFLPLIYELDSRDEWTHEECWPKANPGLGTIKSIDQLRTKVRKAKQNSALVKNLLTKDFDVPETSTEAWMPLEEIINPETFDMETVRGTYAIGGVDLSSTTDLTCATLLIMKDGDPTTYVLQQYFIPEEFAQQRKEEDEVPYDVWEERGLVTFCEGHNVNYTMVTEWFQKMMNDYDITPLWIGYDPWNAQYWVREMEDNGFQMEEVRQGARTMSQPMKILRSNLKAKQVNYNNHSILRWCLANTSIKEDDNENIRPVKGLSQKRRIDGAVALIIAYVILQNKYQDYMNMI
ncbi:terminase large subunit [Jeotgalibacillus aurantiacus]|uniref:terminase large subunit n=1 Tax=Jeotgalibacillus aurantiacus TaxID=2763266 RepID=UPI001D0B70B1|nr:terminase TerL endonuclease subunit [Jeotgalibacillus aurantiacus]